MVQWVKTNLTWFKALGRSKDEPEARDNVKKLLVVVYEDLVKDTEAQLRRILEFLLTTEEAESLDLTCVMERTEGIYKRSKKPMEIELYDTELTNLLKQHREMVYGAMGLKVPPLPIT